MFATNRKSSDLQAPSVLLISSLNTTQNIQLVFTALDDATSAKQGAEVVSLGYPNSSQDL